MNVKKPTLKNTFVLSHRKDTDTGKHYLTFSPHIPAAQYPPREIEIDLFQWNELQYNFAIGINDLQEKTKIGYLINPKNK